MDITNLSLIETIKKVEEGELSWSEIGKAYLERIERLNPDLNAFLTVSNISDGIPAAIKDAISTRGTVTTAGSKILDGYLPPYNATVIDKLLENGVSVIGKTNMDEFAMGSSGENSAYGVTKNPWDMTKVPGGSSSGSAVAVAANMALFALGSDTGGSIRQPASLCGVVGYKPSYGMVSRYGLIAMASSLDQIGTFTKTVADARLVMSWIAGDDGRDSNTAGASFDVSSSEIRPIKGLRIGVPSEYFEVGLDEGVRKQIQSVIDDLEQQGAEIVPVTLPHSNQAVAVYYIIMASEVSSNLGRFSGLRFGGSRQLFGDEVKRRIMLGTFALSSGYFDDYFIKAAKVRKLIADDFEKVFDHSGSNCDVIIGPVSPSVAWELGEKITDPLKMYLSDVYTIPTSLAGLPALSIPCGLSDGLPVGLQVIGRAGRDEDLLDIAESIEKMIGFQEGSKI